MKLLAMLFACLLVACSNERTPDPTSVSMPDSQLSVLPSRWPLPPSVRSLFVPGTDITATLQAQMDRVLYRAVSSGPVRLSVVTLPAGTYLISGTLKPHEGLELKGAGMNQTTLLKTGVGHLLDWYGAWPKSGLTVRDLTLDANGIDGIVGLEWVSDVLFERVTFKNTPYWGINLGTLKGDDPHIRNSNITVRDSVFEGNTSSYEFVLIANSKDVLLERNTFKNAQSKGIGVGLYQNCAGVTLKENLFQNLHIGAYYSLSCDNLRFVGNTFFKNGDGIQGANQSDHGNFGRTHVKDLMLEGNLFEQNTGTPLELGAVDGATVTVNRFVNNLEVGMLIDFGRKPVSSAPRNLKITQNVFVGNNASGTYPDLHPDVLLVGQGAIDLASSTLENNRLGTPITFFGGRWTGLTLSPNTPIRLLEGSVLSP